MQEWNHSPNARFIGSPGQILEYGADTIFELKEKERGPILLVDS